MKPTYEQLEQQLAVAISEHDAAVNAERIWEKTMMQACGEDGPASVADEIAALRAQRDTALESLRQQLATVVAENDNLVNFITCKHWCASDCMPETPATDAYLAEVRASAIEHAASERWGSGYVFDELNEFAAQLRQGAAQ